ncbi:MAG: hypothetical protein OXC54_02925 [Rhodospirillaceae bacterium]|nr:hypothetical protein [Rhodospirillaceae bacterium]MCY4238811.1 hypothetical protein [Rhodospirillaceae bacterium]MCY4310256.1 hypothetical protein [Rhodospirillaceae bacterium]
MIFAVLAVLAASCTFLTMVLPTILGSVLVLALLATGLRLAVVAWMLRTVNHNNGSVRRGLTVLCGTEVLFLTALAAGIPVDPHIDGGTIGWLSLVLWLVYGGASVYGGLNLIPAEGWVRGGGIAVAAAGGFWFTMIGLIVWPFAMAAGYLCFAMAGLKSGRSETV